MVYELLMTRRDFCRECVIGNTNWVSDDDPCCYECSKSYHSDCIQNYNSIFICEDCNESDWDDFLWEALDNKIYNCCCKCKRPVKNLKTDKCWGFDQNIAYCYNCIEDESKNEKTKELSQEITRLQQLLRKNNIEF